MREETKRVYRSVFNQFGKWIRQNGISPEQASEYVQQFVETLSVSEKTKEVYASAIRHFLRGPSGSVIIPSWDSEGSWIDWRNRAIASLVSDSSLSLRAISELNREDYCPDSDYIYYHSGNVAISDRTKEAINKYLELCPIPPTPPPSPLFLSATGKRMGIGALRAAVVAAFGEMKNVRVSSIRTFSPPSGKLSLEEFGYLLTTDKVSLPCKVAVALSVNGVPLDVIARVRKSDFVVDEEIYVLGHKIIYGEQVVKEWICSTTNDYLLSRDGPITKQMTARIISDSVFAATGKKASPRLLYRYYRQAIRKAKKVRPHPITRLIAKMERMGISVDADTIRESMKSLGPREQDVLVKRYEKGLVLREIGREMGVSRQMVYTIESRAIQNLARAIRSRK